LVAVSAPRRCGPRSAGPVCPRRGDWRCAERGLLSRSESTAFEPGRAVAKMARDLLLRWLGFILDLSASVGQHFAPAAVD
jgi:hypothetical protein